MLEPGAALGGQAASPGNPVQLEPRGGGTDVRVKPAARRGDRVRGNRCRFGYAVFGAIGGDAVFDRNLQLL